MFICRATIGYNAGKKVAELSDGAYAALRAAVSSDLKEKMPEDRTQFKPDNFFGYTDHIMDDEEVDALTRAGIEVELKSIRGLSRGTRSSDPMVQHVTQISLANIGLLEVDQVTYMEDACTDGLQSELDAGWRILCVCPPKDSRRPTYILGRRKA